MTSKSKNKNKNNFSLYLIFNFHYRDRRSKAPVFNPEEAANLIFDQKCKINIDKSVGASRSAIMFGREKGGLNNEV